MIPTVRFAKSGLETSRLAIGTSRLHYMRSEDRQRLLAAALDLGFTHIDTAPSYGDGLAEREVGQFIRDRRSRVVLATKYGIPPNPIAAALPPLAMPVLAARALWRKAGLARSSWPAITPPLLRSSTERSLLRLRTDCIDVLLFHEPSPERIVSIEGILSELQDLRQRGLIRHFGLAGAWQGVSNVLALAPTLGQIVQTQEGEWPADRPPDITYGAIASGPQTAVREAVDPALAMARLHSALGRRAHGTVIVSTTRQDRLRIMAQAAVDQLPMVERRP